MKSKVVFSTFNFAPPFLGPTLEMIQRSIDEGSRVYFITCLKSFASCGFNTRHYKYMCDLCVYRFKRAKVHLSGNYNLIRLEELFQPSDLECAQAFMSKQQPVTKELYYGGFDVGESVLSSYISKTRDRDLELSDSEADLPELVFQTILVYEAVKRFLKEKEIDEVILFNGRWDYYRAVFRAANELGIAVNVYENLRSGGYIEVYGNNFPHIILNKQRRFDQLWKDTPDEEYRRKIAFEYFSRKRNGEVVVGRAYTQHQQRNLIPEGIDSKLKNLVVFNSSDDEFAAVAGDEYKNPFFSTQLEGILFLAELVSSKMKDTHRLIIRMHPNLKGVAFGYVSPVYTLGERFSNVVVVPPESEVDSYALLDIADKVITFGSSIGIEANYWRKPVILLAKPYYFYSDVAYIPGSQAEIPALLNADLEPKPLTGSEKIALYMMKGGVKATYYDYQYGKSYKFREFRIDRIPFLIRNLLRLLKVLKVRNTGKRMKLHM